LWHPANVTLCQLTTAVTASAVLASHRIYILKIKGAPKKKTFAESVMRKDEARRVKL